MYNVNASLYSPRPSPPKALEQALAGELDLARRLAVLESTLGNAYTPALGQLEFIFVVVPDARTVVWKVDARKRVGA